MASAPEAEVAAVPTDYVRVKRKKTTYFLYMEPKLDTVHDLRAKINHIAKVPTTDVRFFIDKDGEIPLDENKCLEDQKVRRAQRPGQAPRTQQQEGGGKEERPRSWRTGRARAAAAAAAPWLAREPRGAPARTARPLTRAARSRARVPDW